MVTVSLTRLERARIFLLLGGLTAFGPLSIAMYLPALPAIGRDLATSESVIQLTLTASLTGLAVGQVIAGPLSDSWGRRRPVLLGAAGYVLASLLCALAPSAPLLVGFRLLQGLAGGAGIVIARAVVRDMYSGVAAAQYFSRLVLIMGVAPILAPVLGAQLLRVTSWHGIFVALALVSLGLLGGAFVGLPETLPQERRREGSLSDTSQTFARLARDSRFMGYALAGGLAFSAMFAYIAGSPFVLQGIYRMSPQTFSLIFGLTAVGFVITSQVNASLVSHVAPSRLLLIGLVAGVTGAAALFVVIVAGIPGLVVVVPPLFVLVSSIGFVVPNATALALSRHPEAAGTGSAVLGLIQGASAAVAAPLVGIAGPGSALPMAATIATFSAGAVLAFLWNERGGTWAAAADRELIRRES